MLNGEREKEVDQQPQGKGTGRDGLSGSTWKLLAGGLKSSVY
jgi:hypothetical protein